MICRTWCITPRQNLKITRHFFKMLWFFFFFNATEKTPICCDKLERCIEWPFRAWILSRSLGWHLKGPRGGSISLLLNTERDLQAILDDCRRIARYTTAVAKAKGWSSRKVREGGAGVGGGRCRRAGWRTSRATRKGKCRFIGIGAFALPGFGEQRSPCWPCDEPTRWALRTKNYHCVFFCFFFREALQSLQIEGR